MLPVSLDVLADMARRIQEQERRIERLESLEHANEAFLGLGCLEYIDHIDSIPVGSMTLNVPASSLTLHPWVHLLITWHLYGYTGASIENLLCRINGLTGAGYDYAYHLTKAGAGTHGNAGGATSWVIGRIPGNSHDNSYYGTGWAVLPHYGNYYDKTFFSDWMMPELGVASANRIERGTSGGLRYTGFLRINSITLFAAGTTIGGQFNLYGICPKWPVKAAPPD